MFPLRNALAKGCLPKHQLYTLLPISFKKLKYSNGFDQRVARRQIFLNTEHHATIEEAVLSVDPTDAPIYWLDSDHVTCVYCRSMSVPRLLYNSDRIRSGKLRVTNE
jgi:hypothetical protein